MKPVEVLPEAESESDVAFEWYWSQSESAAIGFSMELSDAFLTIRNHPELYPSYLFGTQRKTLDHYPFSIVFRELLTTIQILAIAHAKRRPGYWKNRL